MKLVKHKEILFEEKNGAQVVFLISKYYIERRVLFVMTYSN